VQIDGLFSIPFAKAQIKPSAELNRDLLNYFDSLNDETDRNEIPTQPIISNLFESKWDLFERQEKSVQFLRESIEGHLRVLVKAVNNYPDEVYATLIFNQQAWFHKTYNGGFFSTHSHPMASWSAVYCVDSGDSAGNTDGILKFYHPNSSLSMYLDAGNAALKEPFGLGTFNVKLRSGDLVIFPSYLQHEVTPYQGSKPRVTVAANYWVESPLINVRA
jgi:uncharacterized protein (TIGR02466 family)